MCKPWVNQILSCANQNQQCVNFFPPYANPYIAAIPKCFAKSSRDTAYFHVLFTCRTFLVQSGEVTFWGQKKFTHFITGLTGLPPDVCIWKNVLRYTDIYRQYIHIHTKCLIHTIHADTCRYTLYTQYKPYIHIHAIQVYTSNTYNTHIFIQYTEIHTIHTHTYICMYVHVCVCIGMYYLYYVGICTNEYVYDSISVYMHVFASMCLNLCVCACICMYLLVCAWICVYVYVFVFLFCTRRKREKVAQARTWCPAMCCQKGNQMPAKLL